MEKVYKFLTSIKFALILFLFIGIFSALATLVPQGKEVEFYTGNYSGLLGGTILLLDFNTFFRSALFLVPSALFFINLLLCSIRRFYKRVKSGVKNRFGPDIIHVGILLIIIGGVINMFERQEGFIWLDPGQEMVILEDWSLRLDNFEYLLYDDGRPRDWLSHVTVLKNGQEVRRAIIEVNKPLKIKNLKLFQNSYNMKDSVSLNDSSGKSISLESNNGIRLSDKVLVFSNVDRRFNGKGIFRELHGDDNHTIFAGVGENVAGFEITGFTQNEATGLSVVKEPAYYLIYFALLILTFGLALTYIQKIGARQ